MSKETKLAYGVMGLTALLVVVFHTLTFDHPSGWPFLVFLWLLIGGMIIFRAGIESAQNVWSYLFLGPVALVSVAQILYSNPVVRGPGDMIALVSSAFFAYWLFAPKINLSDVRSFWSRSWFTETFLPIEQKGVWNKLSVGSTGKQAVFGILVAVPFALLFLVLFVSADALIGKVINSAFHLDDPGKFVAQCIFDAILAIYLLLASWTAISRAVHNRHAHWNTYTPNEAHAMFIAFLSVLNVLFLGFIGFQFVYFFGGQGIVESYGLTYANYAREGFFQLFTASVVVFGLICSVAWFTRLKSLAVRMLSLALIVQCWVVIASATKRLSLYVAAYGLSVQRWWALAGLFAAAVGLTVLFIWIASRANLSALSKTLTAGALYIFAGMMLINHEAIIVQWNIDRPANVVAPDYGYPVNLSGDAMPVYLAWLKQAPDETRVKCVDVSRLQESISWRDGSENYRYAPYCTVGELKKLYREFVLHEWEKDFSDIRAWNLSDARALEALKTF